METFNRYSPYIVNSARELPKLREYLARFYALSALAHTHEGNSDQARIDADQAVRIDAARAHLCRGGVLLMQKYYASAAEAFTCALQISPELLETRILRAAAWNHAGNYAAALAEYNDVVEANPENAIVYNDRGENLFAAGHYAEALDDFQTCIDLEAGIPHPLAGKAAALHAMGDTQQAVEIWRALFERDARFADPGWAGERLNWSEPLVEEARRLAARLAQPMVNLAP